MKYGVASDYEVYELEDIKGDVLFQATTRFKCLKWAAKNRPREEKVKKAGKMAWEAVVPKTSKAEELILSVIKEPIVLSNENPSVMINLATGEIVPQIEDKSPIETFNESMLKDRELVIVTYEDLRGIMTGGNPVKLREAVPYINEIMAEFFIADTFQRSVDFLAQVGHESGSFNYTEEIASGVAYEGRADLGNTYKGDGVKFKGRTYVQITGRFNYSKFEDYVLQHEKWAYVLQMQLQKTLVFGVNHPFLDKPSILTMQPWCSLGAGWYWESRNLIQYSDKNDFQGLTRRINGGLNGYQDRVNYRMRATEVLERFKHLTL